MRLDPPKELDEKETYKLQQLGQKWYDCCLLY
jgi:hypothetical protein